MSELHIKLTVAADVCPTLDISYNTPQLQTNNISTSADVTIIRCVDVIIMTYVGIMHQIDVDFRHLEDVGF